MPLPRLRFKPIPPDAPLAILLLFMLAVGIALRVQNLGVPGTFLWDEHHFVENARNYLANRPDWNDHPPLSKLLIAAAMRLTGDTPAGWRTASLLFGLINIPLLGWAAFLAFRSRRAALMASAFVAADGMFIAYSRTALFDGIIVALAVAGLVSVFFGRTLWHVLLSGVCIGMALSLKLYGLAFVPAALVACMANRHLRRWTPLLALCLPLVFYAQYAYGLHITGRPASIAAVLKDNRDMVRHHLSFTEVHPWSSRWYTWFVPTKPIFFRRDRAADGTLQVLFAFGHPLLWWASSLAVIGAAGLLIRTGWRRVWQQISLPPAPKPVSGTASVDLAANPLGERAGSVFWLLAAWAAPLAFWIPSLRDSFLYHYMASYAFGLVLLAGFADRLYAGHRLWTLVGLAIVAEVLLYYAPLWGELPIAEGALRARLFRF
ncbi:phospholipid carrier-dependent glycosyltransferase [Myxococcota bacterium]